jgi:hypothetical protein
MTWSPFVLALPVLVLASSFTTIAAPKPEYRLAVFVRSAADLDGFTDPSKDRQDSLKDLMKQLRRSDIVAPVDTAEEAMAVLEVLERSTRDEMNGWTFVNGQRQNKSFLTVHLTAGAYSTEFTGESKSKGMFTGYGQAAERVVKQLEAWVNANRERLMTAPVR